MKRFFRMTTKLVGFLMAGFLVIVVAALVFANVYDWNNARPHIANLSKKYLSQEIRIDGPLQVRLGVHPKLSAENVTIESPEGVTKTPLFKAELFSIRLDLWPIIEQVVLVPEIILKNSAIHMVSNADGINNWMFSSVEEAKQRQANQSRGNEENDSDSWLDVVISKVEIKQVNFTYNQDVIQSDINRFTSYMDSNSQVRFEGNGSFNDLPFALNGNAKNDQSLATNAGVYNALLNLKYDDVDLQAEGRFGGDSAGSMADVFFAIEAKGRNLHRVLAALGYVTNGELAPFELRTTLESDKTAWSLRNIKISLGESHASGLVQFLKESPTRLKVEATSKNLTFADFGAFSRQHKQKNYRTVNLRILARIKNFFRTNH